MWTFEHHRNNKYDEKSELASNSKIDFYDFFENIYDFVFWIIKLKNANFRQCEIKPTNFYDFFII